MLFIYQTYRLYWGICVGVVWVMCVWGGKGCVCGGVVKDIYVYGVATGLCVYRVAKVLFVWGGKVCVCVCGGKGFVWWE